MFSREKIGKAAKELADQLQVIEHVKALQQAQKEIAEAMARLSDRITVLEANIRAIKAEVMVDTMRETQQIVNSVQGDLNQRVEKIAVQVAVLKAGIPLSLKANRSDSHPALPLHEDEKN